jgi:hypothetical protein
MESVYCVLPARTARVNLGAMAEKPVENAGETNASVKSDLMNAETRRLLLMHK